MTLPIVSPAILGQYRPVLVNRWQVSTLSWVPWDGSLTTGALTIGKVDQGVAGTDPWLTTSGFALPEFDAVILSFTDATKATMTTAVFKTGGAAGATVATITLTSGVTTDTYVKT